MSAAPAGFLNMKKQAGMSDRPPSIRDWPRGMSIEVAAEYCGISASLLRRDGPSSVRVSKGRQVWLREDLDNWLDRLAGKASKPERNPWLEE